MAVELITTAKAFTPSMIGDIVEVTMYDTRSGETAKATGTLRAYSTSPGALVAEFEGDRDVPAIKTPTEGVTLTINHFEYLFAEIDTEDDK